MIIYTALAIHTFSIASAIRCTYKINYSYNNYAIPNYNTITTIYTYNKITLSNNTPVAIL